MKNVTQEYLKEVIGDGDTASVIINRTLAPTIEGNDFVDVLTQGMNGIAVIRPPQGYEAVAFTTTGDVSQKDPKKYVTSTIRNAVAAARSLNIMPVGFSDNLDTCTKDPLFIQKIAEVMRDEIFYQRKQGFTFSGLNGECAVMPGFVSADYGVNMSLSMVGFRRTNRLPSKTIIDIEKGVLVVRFNPNGNPIYLNSDGVGTKPELYVRRSEIDGSGCLIYSQDDSAAMKDDDSAKLLANIIATFDLLERKGWIPLKPFRLNANYLSKKLGFPYLLLDEYVGDRLMGYSSDASAFSLGGTNVCTIDEGKLKHHLIPNLDDLLIVMQSPIPNPRSNGISALRGIAKEIYGEQWHKNPEAKYLLEYLSSPSTIFYPLFMQLLNQELITAVYHMSGGAFNGKLARPLIKNGLHASIDNLFEPAFAQQRLIELSKTKTEHAYATLPMNNEGFVTCHANNAHRVIGIITAYGLNAKIAGKIEKATDKNGVTLKNIYDSTGKPIRYDGEKLL